MESCDRINVEQVLIEKSVDFFGTCLAALVAANIARFMAADAVALIDVDEHLAADRLHVFVTVARLRRAVPRRDRRAGDRRDLSKANEAEVTSSAEMSAKNSFFMDAMF